MFVFKLSWLPYILIAAGLLIAIDGQPEALILTAAGAFWLYYNYKSQKDKNEGGQTASSQGTMAHTAAQAAAAATANGTSPAGAAEAPKPAAPTVAPEPAPQVRFCTSCGTKITGEAKFCPGCGREL